MGVGGPSPRPLTSGLLRADGRWLSWGGSVRATPAGHNDVGVPSHSASRLPAGWPKLFIAMLSRLIDHPDVTETMDLAGPVGVMALHGGLERHTDMIANAVADRTGASRYVVSQPSELGWHLPSTRWDPTESRALDGFLQHVHSIVSIHGFGRDHLRRSVLVGGMNESLRTEMSDALARRTTLRIVTGDQVPPGLRGMHPANPVNRPERAGVQLELSHTPRRPPHVASVIDAIAEVVDRNQTG